MPDRPSGLGQVAVIRGDARALPLPDASVDLIVTSPPYWALRSYTDGGAHYDGQIGAEPTPGEYVDALIDCTREWMRVLKPTGSLWINLGDKYAQATERSRNGQGARKTTRAGGLTIMDGYLATNTVVLGARENGVPQKSLIGLPWRYALRAVDDLGLILRAEIIWSKPNGLPESVTDRVRRSHEQWFHLVKQPRYYSAVDEIRTPASDFARPRNATRTRPPPPGNRPRAMADTVNPLGALPGSVWTIATQPLTVPPELDVQHYAAFPLALPRRIIAGWTPPGGLIVDPFGGTGTSALAARALGRDAISVDMSTDYCRLAGWRTQDPGELARAMQVSKPPPVPEAQLDLFGADHA